jgi:hypothetical protein
MRAGWIAWVALTAACVASTSTNDAAVTDGRTSNDVGVSCGRPPGPICGPAPSGLQTAEWCSANYYPGACYQCPGSPGVPECLPLVNGYCELADPCGTPPCWLQPWPCMDASVDAWVAPDGSSGVSNDAYVAASDAPSTD